MLIINVVIVYRMACVGEGLDPPAEKDFVIFGLSKEK